MNFNPTPNEISEIQQVRTLSTCGPHSNRDLRNPTGSHSFGLWTQLQSRSQKSNKYAHFDLRTHFSIGTFSLIRSSRIQPQDFIIGLFDQNLKTPNNNNSYQK